MHRPIIKLVYFLYRKVLGLFDVKRFEIKRGYVHRSNYRYYDGTSITDEYQKEVYLQVRQYMLEHSLNKIIDVGCGSAYKLMTYLSNFDTLGLDVTSTYNFLKEKYPSRNWINVDEIEDYGNLNADVVVCADVIEHVLDPDKLLSNIMKINGLRYLFISTPDRDIVRGHYDYGPPGNVHHIREWNGREFNRYLSQSFEVLSHQITDYANGTQLLICRPKV